MEDAIRPLLLQGHSDKGKVNKIFSLVNFFKGTLMKSSFGFNFTVVKGQKKCTSGINLGYTDLVRNESLLILLDCEGSQSTERDKELRDP